MLLAGAVACQSEPLAESIWPPSDFEIQIEEVQLVGSEARVVRRFRAGADGLVAYGTSANAIVDPVTRTLLPVFDRLSVYRLVPMSMRALVRRLDDFGIGQLDRVQGERGAVDGPSLALSWHAFGRGHVITARGRVHGAMAEILALIAAHLPPGEGFALPGLADRLVVPVLRGVPEPRTDAAGSLAALAEMLIERPDDSTVMLDAFALACHLIRRDKAEEMLRRWTVVMDKQRPPDMFPEEEPRLVPAVLQRMLPAPQ